MVIKDIRAGDTYKISFTADYDSSVFTPKLILNNQHKKYEKTGSGSFEITISAAETAEFLPGEYAYSLVMFSIDERYTIESGFLNIIGDLAAGETDSRTANKKILDAIEATIQGVASLGQQQTSINGRSIVRYSPDELLKLHSHFKRLVRQDESKAKYGTGNRKIMVRF